jgi:hypothetical protein
VGAYIGKRTWAGGPPRYGTARAPDLGEALASGEPPFAAVTVVPVRSARRLLGMALLYHTMDDALPRTDELSHMGSMALALSASLELASALDGTREADRLRQGALLGAAGVRSSREMVDILVALRDGLGGLRQAVQAGPLRESFGRLTLPLAGALARSRAVLALVRGAPERELVELAELLGELPPGDAQVATPCPVASVSGDATMLRLGLLALLSASGGRRVEARREGGYVKIRVGPAAPERAAAAEDFPPSVHMALAQRVAELHSGSVSREADDLVTWLTLSLPGV